MADENDHKDMPREDEAGVDDEVCSRTAGEKDAC